jgi:N-acylglucosamine 2-epimerase
MTFDWKKIHRTYQSLLWDAIVPFWFRHGVDREFGGVLSCMTEEGARISTDKYMWSQWRWVWVLSRLYLRSGRSDLLEAAQAAVRFLLDHGRDEEGRWYFRITRTGQPVEGPISVYSDCFAIYGLSEYFRATRDVQALEVALATYTAVCRRVEARDFHDVAPATPSPGRRLHSIPMILLETSHELEITTGDSDIARSADGFAARILDFHIRPELQVLLETLDWNYSPLPPPAGTIVDPGHAIESMWFVMHWALSRGNQPAIRKAAEVVRWHLERGWDPEYGGIYLEIDARGGAAGRPNSEKKVWWTHTEALYAILLAGSLTGADWCGDWFRRVEDWSLRHFALPDGREWRQRLDRAGNPVTELIALPVKDPFHLPRAASHILDLSRKMSTDPSEIVTNTDRVIQLPH